MKIIIVGIGKVGVTLANFFSREGHDVTVIDKNQKLINDVVNKYDVMGVCGNGVSLDVLDEADIKNTDILIASASTDETNMLVCVLAKKMGVKNTIARIRNPEYAVKAGSVYNELGITMIANPEFNAAEEIYRIIRFPSAANLDSFARGKIEIARVRIHSDNIFCNMPIYEIRKKCKAKILICAVQRDDNVYIPSGDFVLRCDDTISITGTRAEISNFMKQTGVYKQKIKNVMIIGGGRIAYYLSKLLSDTGRNIKLIEQNEKRCYDLADTLSDDVTVIHGDGTDQDILDEQGLERQDALVSLTGIDEENIIVSMYAESKGVNKIITKVNRHSYSILNDIGLETVVSPQIVAGNLVTRYVRALHNSAGNSQIQTPSAASPPALHTSSLTARLKPLSLSFPKMRVMKTFRLRNSTFSPTSLSDVSSATEKSYSPAAMTL